eukprot:1697672-Rhodomonas_salina.1
MGTGTATVTVTDRYGASSLQPVPLSLAVGEKGRQRSNWRGAFEALDQREDGRLRTGDPGEASTDDAVALGSSDHRVHVILENDADDDARA